MVLSDSRSTAETDITPPPCCHVAALGAVGGRNAASRLGEYGSVGAGAADWAEEIEAIASTTNEIQAVGSFLIGVFGPGTSV